MVLSLSSAPQRGRGAWGCPTIPNPGPFSCSAPLQSHKPSPGLSHLVGRIIRRETRIPSGAILARLGWGYAPRIIADGHRRLLECLSAGAVLVCRPLSQGPAPAALDRGRAASGRPPPAFLACREVSHRGERRPSESLRAPLGYSGGERGNGDPVRRCSLTFDKIVSRCMCNDTEVLGL
jgi:hypothetical protein